MMANAKCDWGGCGRPGDYQIGLRMWALATAAGQRTNGNSLKMLTSVCVCRECRPKVKASDFTLPEMRERVNSAMMSIGRAAPDFDAAELVFDEIIDAPVDLPAEARAAKLMGKPVWEA